jgi:hypothetical protein
MSGIITLRVEAIDNNQETASDEIQIIKWRLHPALIAAGAAVAIKGAANIALGKPAFGWTIVRGTTLFAREQGNSLIFRALRLHYTEISASNFISGTIRNKKVKLSDVGFNRLITLGPLGSLNYIFAISHGNLQELT